LELVLENLKGKEMAKKIYVRALTVNEARPMEKKDFDSSRGGRGGYGRR
jgi:hypothetical protein